MEEGGQVSAFPMPPMEYIKLYSMDNINQGLAPAPPPPIQGHYAMFGQTINTDDEIVQPLEAQNIRRLYPQGNFDHKSELKKLNHSILANFLDLLEMLVRCPSNAEKERKLEDLKLLFINLHHLINEYRSHQARETLKLMLEVQHQERLETVKRFRIHFEAVLNNLKRCLNEIPEEVCSSVYSASTAVSDSSVNKVGLVSMTDLYTKRDEKGNFDDVLMCKLIDEETGQF